MKKLLRLTVFLVVSSISFSFAQNQRSAEDVMVNEIAPSDFKNYTGKVLVVPGFRGIGTTKWLTKQFTKYYGKPFHVADVKEIATGFELKEYPVEEYKYMVFIQSFKSHPGNNTYYKFQLVDRSTQTVYYHHKSGKSLKKYIRKILE